MKKAKIMLSAVAAVAAIGGAFALKSSKAVGNFRILYEDTLIPDGICTTASLGYLAPNVTPNAQAGYHFGNATITVSLTKACTPKYYNLEF